MTAGDALNMLVWIAYLAGALVTVSILSIKDSVTTPKINLLWNFAAAVIWPALVLGYAFEIVRRGKR